MTGLNWHLCLINVAVIELNLMIYFLLVSKSVIRFNT